MLKFYSFCARVLLFHLSISVEFSSMTSLDDLHVYETHVPAHTSLLSFEYLFDESHHIEKRQTELSVRKTATSIDTNGTNPQDVNKLTEIGTETKLPMPLLFNKTTRAPPDQTKLIGVNGTGQRKNYPSTTDKPVLLTPYPPSHDVASNKSGKQNFDDVISNISISKFTEKELNNTLARHNITNETITESNYYYNSTLITDQRVARFYWVNLTQFENSTTHKLLSSAHRRAATVTLSFDFPFYGHIIRNITIATGGFLYTGDYVHAWLAATQYIAPLMANFDTSLTNNSFVRYLDNGTAFTVLWERVALKDRADEGEFTFQTTLHKNGDIIFVYRNIPLIIGNIKDDQHPVKVGLSDAYIIDSTLFFLRRKTIYEYHRVNFQREVIKNGTVIFLKALPTCLDANNCTNCLAKDLPSFQCVWCPALSRCSSGVDRHRQEWIMKGCDQTRVMNMSQCSRSTTYDNDESKSAYVHESNGVDVTDSTSAFRQQTDVIRATPPDDIGTSSVLAIMILFSMIGAISMWVIYAYRNPHTTSGQMLIRYRPTQWRWKRGEARYTAATIHM
ncbi:plexin domain-containing protein 2 isoform X2 [Coccinella septempunctata]|uniref:plexin domain-containing protein 2 isoform X2 n=1 Tax=Coccinella septempunctata TaxID=41139 RepID=UPI001D07F0F1|nr:plexin domain-containing protein 2 isoform X2 [Coccinella septempunctata]